MESLIEEKFLCPKFAHRIPEITVFDIETFETETDEGYEHKLVSIAMASEIDDESKYWVIEEDSDAQRQLIGVCVCVCVCVCVYKIF